MTRNNASIKIICSVILLALLGVFLGRAFSGSLILKQSFNLGPLVVRYYGLFMVFAVLAGFYLAKKRAVNYVIVFEEVENLLFWLILDGFIGARLYHVFSSFDYYAQNPIEIFKVWHGGLSIYGAVLGGIATLFVYKKFFKSQNSIFQLLDWLAPSVLLGQIIGRFGNFFNYELFGYPTNLPWKMFVPAAFRPEGFFSQAFFHPLFLYEMLANFFILAILLKFQKNLRSGALFFSYLFLYNIVRFFLEFMRIDSVFLAGFRQNAMVSAFVALGSLVVIFRFKMYAKTP